MKYKVTFLPDNKVLEIEEGTSLLEAQIKAGYHPDAPCGGKGTCGKCLVDIVEGENVRTVRACQHVVKGDMTLGVRGETEHNLLTTGLQRKFELAPAVRAAKVKVARCVMGDNSSDWQRVKEAVSGALGIDADSIPVNYKLLDKVFDTLEDNDYQVTAVVYNNEIIDLVKEVKPYGVAIDIGTTSVVCYLLDLANGAEKAHSSTLNPQTEFGGDVIARCEYAIAEGVDKLSSVIRKGLNELIAEACGQAKISKDDVYVVTIVGNTAMHHLFMGITPKPLVHAPYNTSVNNEIVVDAVDVDIDVNPRARVQLLSNIAGFVGADTAGVLLATAFDEIEELTLVIDIGTNGEMVMGTKDSMIACSTAAGPAFEGAKIEMGMRGRAGAIDHVKLEADGNITCTVIDNAPAEGICGSGLMDAVAVLLETGIVTETGKIVDPDEVPEAYAQNASRIGKNAEDIKIFMLKDNVYISQKDIREVQLAKGAIAAGIELMADSLGVKVGDVKNVMIAGAFGNYMDSHSACAIGMIPPELEERITLIGNGAGEGAKIATLNDAEYRRAEKITSGCRFLELATHPDFQDTFVDHLMFE